jgi:Flp pilus assembly protein TadD
LGRLGKIDAAIAALETAVEVLPGNSRAYYALGILFDRKNLPEEAAIMYRKSREKRNR